MIRIGHGESDADDCVVEGTEDKGKGTDGLESDGAGAEEGAGGGERSRW